MANILALICARAGSKGVKGKNIRDFLGFPIAYYTLSAYSLFLDCYADKNSIYTLVLNTDSEDLIMQFAKTRLPHTVIPRTESLSGDSVSKIDVIRDSLSKAESLSSNTYDIVLDMDLTSPLRKASDIKNIIDALVSDKGADIALSVTEPRRNPYFNQLVKDENGYLKTAIKSNFVTRQQAPEVFDANASLYAYNPRYLKNSDGIFLHAALVGAMMEDTGILDIDSEKDFELMQVVAQYLFKNDSELAKIRENIPSILK